MFSMLPYSTHCAFCCVTGNLTCARDLFLEFRISPSFHGQAEEFNSTFVSLVKNPNNTQMFGGQYRLVSCWQNCRNKGAHHPPGSKKDNNGEVWLCLSRFRSLPYFFFSFFSCFRMLTFVNFFLFGLFVLLVNTWVWVWVRE